MNGSETIIVCGHYGSGKTNLSVNLAVRAAKAGRRVAVADLDIVNPYFRTADFSTLFKELGVELIAPMFANSNLDSPVLPPRLASAIGESGKTLVIDVGGDDDGAVALGGFSQRITDAGYSMLYVINRSRYLEDDVKEELRLLRSVESCSRLAVTGLVNNTNLGGETTPELIQGSQSYVEEISRLAGVPVAYTVAEQSLCSRLAGTENLLAADIYVKAPWQRQ